ncbi:DUF3489 domain-containing protein [Sphingomonas sp. RB1R13]|uniref:DUF3489 domain-containing protein n=1 Tax=Sphingomonas sp. RB1R13 TaxID=3096159 RepID=UPI002FCA7078
MSQPSKASLASKLTGKQVDAPNSSEVLSKSATFLGLLRREEGATLAELADATGWQPQSTRAMLTGLRKKGHVIERGKRGDVTCYQLPVSAA